MASASLSTPVMDPSECISKADMMDALRKLQQNRLFSDCAVCSSDGAIVLCHAVLLAAKAPHLRQLLQEQTAGLYLVTTSLSETELLNIINEAYIYDATDMHQSDLSSDRGVYATESFSDCALRGSGSEIYELQTHAALLVSLCPPLANLFIGCSPGKYCIRGLPKQDAVTMVGRVNAFLTHCFRCGQPRVASSPTKPQVAKKSTAGRLINSTFTGSNRLKSQLSKKFSRDDQDGNFQNRRTPSVEETPSEVDDDTTDNNALAIADPTNSVVSEYTCSVCHKSFPSDRNLGEHGWIHSDMKPYPCRLCSQQFTWRGSYYMHIRKRHPKAGASTARIKLLLYHDPTHRDMVAAFYNKKVDKHPQGKKLVNDREGPDHNKRHRCDICQVSYYHQKSYRMHMAEKHPGPPQIAPRAVSEKVVDSPGPRQDASDANIHTREDTSSTNAENTNCRTGRYKCRFCEKSSFGLSFLTDHEWTHTGQKPHKCAICGEKFAWCVQYYTHMKKVHPDDQAALLTFCSPPHNVSEDSKVYTKDSSKNNLTCQFCSRTFLAQQGLSRHLKTHIHNKTSNLQKPLLKAMSVSKSEALPASGLKYKRKTMKVSALYKKYQYKCPDCAKTFARKYILAEHRIAIHARQKQYSCYVCHKEFYWNSHLHRHFSKYHPGVQRNLKRGKIVSKNFKKPLINNFITTSSQNRKTMASSKTGGKQRRLARCQFCLKIFPTKAHSLLHEKSHKGEKRRYCADCDQSFHNTRDFVKHLGNIHKVDVDSDTRNKKSSRNKLKLRTTESEADKSIVDDPVKEFHCPYCYKAFPNPFTLQRHTKQHQDTGEKPLYCHLCDATFCSVTEARQHVLKHSEVVENDNVLSLKPSVSKQSGVDNNRSPQKKDSRLANNKPDIQLTRKKKHKCKWCTRSFPRCL